VTAPLCVEHLSTWSAARKDSGWWLARINKGSILGNGNAGMEDLKSIGIT